ncbi:hypothetical protein L596_008605 [Steinernema carpocapsae]|nr:hypothetical protein L596_008605 [Steinernema carpocapsae]
MREGGNSAGLGPATAVCRLSAVKSVVQVRCRPCQEILSCFTCSQFRFLISLLNLVQLQLLFPSSSALREHCHSRSHQSRLAYLGVACSASSSSSSLLLPMHEESLLPDSASSPPGLLQAFSSTVFECRVCPFTTPRKPEAMEHLLKHEDEDSATERPKTSGGESGGYSNPIFH